MVGPALLALMLALPACNDATVAPEPEQPANVGMSASVASVTFPAGKQGNMVTPLNHSTVSGSVEIQVKPGIPLSNIWKVKFLIDGKTVGQDFRPKTGTKIYTYAWDTRTVSDSIHKLNAVVFDKSTGKVAESNAKVYVLVANSGAISTAPTKQTTTPPPPPPSGVVPAFPGAQGYGALALSTCDRGDVQVVPVTNLEDSGPGSLRAAVGRADGRRLTVVVFRVGGYIDLASRIPVENGCLYIAGQTAPGDGIAVRQAAGTFRFEHDVHDVVIRYMRFRGGRQSAINIAAGHNDVLDHLSVSWIGEKMIMISRVVDGASGPIGNVTVQRTLLAEPLARVPVAMQIAGNPDRWVGSTPPGWMEVQDISVHHNLFVSAHHRNPNIGAQGVEVVDNVVYNWKMDGGQATRAAKVDWVNNYIKKGPMSEPWRYAINYDCNTGGDGTPWKPSLYISGNVSSRHANPTADAWSGGARMTACFNDTQTKSLNVAWRRATRLPQPFNSPVAVESAISAYSSVLDDVGANKRLDCQGNWVAAEDAADRKFISEVQSGTGIRVPPETVADAGGLPALGRGNACSDADDDGMPDAFEVRYGLNPHSAADAAGDSNRDGYTNLEDYLNGRSPR